MPIYDYVAKDAEGKTVKGKLASPDKNTLIETLRAQNMIPLSMNESASKKKASSGGSLFKSNKVPLSDVVIFARQLATMISAGIPILQSLEIVAEQSDHARFKEILTDVAKKVASGSSIYSAMNAYPTVFSEFFIHIVRAGEESGNLDEILDSVAVYLEKTEKIARQVKSAMVYPIVVMTMAVAITALMIIKVIPVFVDMYSGFGIDLPTPTKVLIAMSDYLNHHFFVIVGLGIAFSMAFKYFAKTPSGTLILDRIKLNLPVFGVLIRKVAVSKFARTLGTLLKSGVSILRALEIVAKTSGNKVLENAINATSKAVKEGRQISDPLSESKVFPPMVVRMIAVGETSGELEKMLSKVADFYDDQVDAAVAGLTSMIEPLVIAFLGIVIGGIVIAMFMPMFQMVNMVS
ncbi:MAG: type IV pilus assembly protein PilC [Candidatus Omnitrophota bacterium]|jgi:type IV pilus assembly protein PilC